VVKIDERAGRIFVIGGNVEQSVSLTILPLRRDGDAYAKPVDDSIIDGARTVFAHLKLRADRVEPNALGGPTGTVPRRVAKATVNGKTYEARHPYDGGRAAEALGQHLDQLNREGKLASGITY